VIDLTASEANLWRALSTNHRRSITSGRRFGIRFRESRGGLDLEALIAFLHATAERNHFVLHSDEYYRRMLAVLGPLGAARLYVSDYQDRAVAATLVLGHGMVRHYAHTAASPDARALKVGALHAWSMMMQARDEGVERFDLWGVAEPDASSSHPWAGLSRFKRSFGGYDVCHSGTWELAVGRRRAGRRRR
jgi:lipid II:glycine glycyltransferase (peptidoglycan interpeptide bridge formation enzyme)